MGQLTYLHKTTSGNIYPLEIGWNSVESSRIPFNKSITDMACQTGCRLYGRNGGCPPYSPNFGTIIHKFSLITFIYVKLLTDYYPPKIIIGNYFIRWSFVEALLGPFANRFRKLTGKNSNQLFLSSGFCKGCGTRKCSVKEGNKCSSPLNRTYSLESTGVLIQDLSFELFGFNLYWWNRTDLKYIPPYMIKMVGILSNHPIRDSDISSKLL